VLTRTVAVFGDPGIPLKVKLSPATYPDPKF